MKTKRLIFVAFAFFSTSSSFAVDVDKPTFFDHCKIGLQAVNLYPVKEVPEWFKFDLVLGQHLDFFKGRFTNWSNRYDIWSSYADVRAISGGEIVPRTTRLRFEVDREFGTVNYWMIAHSNFEAIIDRLRQIIFARIKYKMMHPNEPIPVIRAKVTGINGVTVTLNNYSKATMKFLWQLLMQNVMYPNDVTITDESMSTQDKAEARHWFTGFFDQAASSSTRVIMFEDVIK